MALGLSLVAGTACQDDFRLTAEIVQTEGEPLSEGLRSYGYVIPLSITTNGEWRVEFDAMGERIAYAYPDCGSGDAVVKICVLDNPETAEREGQMTIVFPQDERKNYSVRLRQSSSAGSGENYDVGQVGQQAYGVGYGFDVGAGVVGANGLRCPLLKMERLRDEGYVSEDIVVGTKVETGSRNYTGCTLAALANGYERATGLAGSRGGMRTEASTAFNRSLFSQPRYEFAVSYVDVMAERILIDCPPDVWMDDGLLTEAACKALTGEDPDYPSTSAGFKRLVGTYGTHVMQAAQLGGRLRVATYVDVTGVKGAYSLEAFAQLAYAKIMEVKDLPQIDPVYEASYVNSLAARTSRVKAWGGRPDDAKAVQGLLMEDMQPAIQRWMSGLMADPSTWVCVGVDQENDLVPLYELLPDGDRRTALKAYIETGRYADSQEEESGSQLHIAGIRPFHPDSSLVRDLVDEQGTVMARICNELVPAIDRKSRINVIYPAIDGKVCYQLGYFPGNDYCGPAKVANTAAGTKIVQLGPVQSAPPTEFYVRGGTVSPVSLGEDMETVVGHERLFVAELDKAGQPYSYPTVKMGSLLFLRENYEGKVQTAFSVLDQYETYFHFLTGPAYHTQGMDFAPGWTVPKKAWMKLLMDDMTVYQVQPAAWSKRDGTSGFDAVETGYIDVLFDGDSPSEVSMFRKDCACFLLGDALRKDGKDPSEDASVSFPYFAVNPSLGGVYLLEGYHPRHSLWNSYFPLRLCQPLVDDLQ